MITLTPDVVAAAQGAQRIYRVPASIGLGQYGLESAWGRAIPLIHDANGDVAGSSFNPFGIKALPGQASVTVPTHEFVGGRYVLIHAAFAAYPSLAAAFLAHAQLLATAPIYAAFRAAGSVELACDALTDTYATDPDYGLKLWTVICSEELLQYDLAQTGAA